MKSSSRFSVAVALLVGISSPEAVEASSLLPEIIVTASSSAEDAATRLDTWITDQSDIEARNAITVSEALT